MRVICLCILSWIVLSCGQKPKPAALQSQMDRTNPFVGEMLFVDPQSQAAAAARNADEADARLLKLISMQPQADWLGEWSGSVDYTVSGYLDASENEGKLRVMIVYNVPNRDCGQYSKGGLAGKEEYLEWIDRIAVAVENRKAVFVMEPDALGHLDECLSQEDQAARLDMIRTATARLKKNPGASVYIDAGNANWVQPKEMAVRLLSAGIHSADGFALNTSNYVATDKTVTYGEKISDALGGNVPFIIDTSRNGQGEAPKQEWCNPPGRGLGTAPTTNTGHPLVHAFLWLKRPGESDGTCNNGPPAGAWFEDQALELARNAKL